MSTEQLEKVMFNICKKSNDVAAVEKEISTLNSDEVVELGRFTAMIENLLMDRDFSFYNPTKEI